MRAHVGFKRPRKLSKRQLAANKVLGIQEQFGAKFALPPSVQKRDHARAYLTDMCQLDPVQDAAKEGMTVVLGCFGDGKKAIFVCNVPEDTVSWQWETEFNSEGPHKLLLQEGGATHWMTGSSTSSQRQGFTSN